LIIALAAAAFAAQAFTQVSRAQVRVSALQAQLSSLQRRVGADEQGAARERQNVRSLAARAIGAQRSVDRVNWELQSLPTEAEVAHMRAKLEAFAACIPRLQREIGGLRINWRMAPARSAAVYFRLSTTAPIPASCSPVLWGR
jgi:hypothetical protein